MSLSISQLTHNNSISTLDITEQRQLNGGYGGYSFSFNFSNVSTDLQQKDLNVTENSLAANGSNSITTNNIYPGMPSQPTNPPIS